MLEKSLDLRFDIKMTCLDMLVPAGHLLRKIERTIDFSEIYSMVEHLYCDDNGRPTVDSVVLIKVVLLQHLYGIKSLRQTVREVDMNIAYRWFIGYNIDTPIPHFATISYAFATWFPSELFEDIFAWILGTAVSKGLSKRKPSLLMLLTSKPMLIAKGAARNWCRKWRGFMMNGSGRKSTLIVQCMARNL